MSDRPVAECIREDALPAGYGMRWIPGGTSRMGDDNAYPESGRLIISLPGEPIDTNRNPNTKA